MIFTESRKKMKMAMITFKRGEMVFQRRGIHACKRVRHSLNQVVETPSRDHKIKTHNDKHRQQERPREPLPTVSAGQRTESTTAASKTPIFDENDFIMRQRYKKMPTP